jgi:hypothetical protein
VTGRADGNANSEAGLIDTGRSLPLAELPEASPLGLIHRALSLPAASRTPLAAIGRRLKRIGKRWLSMLPPRIDRAQRIREYC